MFIAKTITSIILCMSAVSQVLGKPAVKDAVECDQRQFDYCLSNYAGYVGLGTFPTNPLEFSAWVTNKDSTIEGLTENCKDIRSLMFCLGAQQSTCFSVENMISLGLPPPAAQFYNLLYLHLSYQCGVGLTRFLRDHVCIEKALTVLNETVALCQAHFVQATDCTGFQKLLDCQVGTFGTVCNTETKDVMCESFQVPLSTAFPMCNLQCPSEIPDTCNTVMPPCGAGCTCHSGATFGEWTCTCP